MGYYYDKIMKHLEDLQAKADIIAAEVTEEVGKEADRYAWRIVKPVVVEGLLSGYEDAVGAWYGAYGPKKYNRSGSFYGRLEVTDGGEMSIGWHISESMSKPTWSGGSTNIYGPVFMGGAHGGVVYGHPPTYSTPIPVMFDESVDALISYAQGQIDELGQAYFEENFPIRFNQRFHI